MMRMLPVVLVFALGIARAADDPKPDPKKKDLEPARAAIAQQDWAQARELLRAALAREPRSADAHNLYAYSLRKGSDPQMDLVFRHYNEALRLDARHRGAHEYLGEAYLMVGNVAKAREHLTILERLCGAACEEHAKLRQAITAAESRYAAK
jgi:cytochrome c-type biogenesis protein CcmH/NrfG